MKEKTADFANSADNSPPLFSDPRHPSDPRLKFVHAPAKNESSSGVIVRREIMADRALHSLPAVVGSMAKNGGKAATSKHRATERPIHLRHRLVTGQMSLATFFASLRPRRKDALQRDAEIQRQVGL